MTTIRWHHILAAFAAIVLAGCSSAETNAETSGALSTSGGPASSDVAEKDTDPTGATAADGTTDSPSVPRFDCPVDETVVDTAIVQVVDAEIVAINPDIGGVGSSEGYSFAYDGCRYTTDGGAEFTVASIIDENGEHTAAPIAAMSKAVAESQDGPGVGDDSFFTRRGVLAVLSGDRTFTVEVKGVRVQDSDRPHVVAMADRVVASGASDPAGWCRALAAGVPTDWGPVGDRPLQGAGSSGGVDYRSCRVMLQGIDGASVQLTVSEGRDMFDELADDKARFDDRAPQQVPDLGDAAFRYGSEEHLLVRVGTRGWVMVGRTSAGEPVDPTTVSALAAAVIPAA